MRLASVQLRFLLRSSGLVIVLLLAWWFVVRDPVLLAFYTCSKLPFAILSGAAVTIEPSGEWAFRARVQDSPDEVLRRMGAARIDSIDFKVPGRDVLLFTLGLPVYLALSLSVPGPLRARTIALGCALQILIGILCVVLFAQVSASHILAQMRPDTSGLFVWALDLAFNLLTGVIPYASPVIAAVWLHPRLRDELFTPPPRTGLPVASAKGMIVGRLR